MKDGTEKTPGGRFSRKVIVIGGALAAALIAIGLWGGYSIGKGEKGEPVVHDHAAEESAEAEVWTCSMHPQIRQPKPGQCPLCAMDLVPVTETGAGDVGARELKLSPAARKLAEIQTSPVERRPVEAELRMVGKVEYDETRVSYITAWVAGRLERLHVNFLGVTVKQGDPMVSIYSPELLAAQEELIQSLSASESIRETDAESLRRTARQTVAAVREKLRLLGLTEEQIAEIETRGTVSEEVTILAPSGGVVVEKNAFEGQFVATGTRIYTIADLSRVWVKLDAYESDLSWVRPGQEVEFSTEAYPGETFTGEVAFIDPILDSRTRTAKVRVNLENPRGRLKPEMFVRAVVRADVGPASNGLAPLVIPASAPLITGKRAVVYLEIEPGLYGGREIVLGPRAGEFYVVEEGLEEGQHVVSQGNFKIDSAIQILAKPSMMNPEGGAPVPGHHHGPAGGPGGSAEELYPGQRFEAPMEFKEQLGQVYQAYLKIHHGLSRDSLEIARAGAGNLEGRLASVDMTLLGNAAHLAWMDYLGGLRQNAGAIRSAGDIEEARTAFDPLSEAMYASVRSFGTGGDRPVYRFNCSMAFDNRGADWLQSSKEVENPYWGAMMYRCGELTETLSEGPEGGRREHEHD
jgi:Cu(I)/Ag(I) efflux system membrane fusion protein